MEWSAGRYETLAEQLRPAAEVVVEAAGPERGESVLDIGCGTGNAALLAAERGAETTGVDPAERLIGVAIAEAKQRGLDVVFSTGEAQDLPVGDGIVDVVVSAFGIIFAPDAEAASAELARVAAPKARLALSTWLPEGPLFEIARMRNEAFAEISGSPLVPPPFAWHDPEALDGLLGPHGFSIEVRDESLEFTAPTPEAFLETEFTDHPLWVLGRERLGAEKLEQLRDRALVILEEANESRAGFLHTSPYVVVTGSRG